MPKLPKFEEWQAPWEKNGTDFDAETAKRLIYNLEAKVEERVGLPDRVRELETELEAERSAKEAAATRARELEDAAATDEAEKQRLADQRWKDELTATVKALAEGKTPGASKEKEAEGSGTELTDADRELALLRAGVPAAEVGKHLKRVSGTTAEELAEDAKSYAEQLGYASGDEEAGVGYDGASGSSEMPSDVPRRGGHRTDLGGNLGNRVTNPADLADLIPR